jgi:hypothetical protein
MSIFEDAAQSLGANTSDESEQATDAAQTRTDNAGTTARQEPTYTTQVRGSTVQVDGDTITIEEPETKQPDQESSNWFTSREKHGVPRGAEAIKMRQIGQTSAMQTIANGISDQLLGGELAFLDNEDVMDDFSDSELETTEQFKSILREILTGPHLGDEDLDDLIVACVNDMLGPANAYLQLLSPQSGDLPVVSLTTLDPLTIRHNVNEHGYPLDPPYWQATGSFGHGTSSTVAVKDPTPLQTEDVAVLRYPKGNRSYRVYPVSASWQVKEWLEILADSVTHHKRYYSDDEVPPGLMQVVDASDSTIKDIQNQVEQASGDPRDFPIVGGEAPANWIEMGGTAINLDVIQEQKWFFQMCLASLGLNKAEVGLVEDVNYSNGEVQADMVYKKVAGPFGKQFERAFVHIANQFDLYQELGEPFTPTLAHTDPRAEQARQERLQQEYEAGKLTLRQYVRRAGDEALAEDDDQYTVEIDGTTVDYGSHPKWVAERLLSNAGATEPDEPQSESESGGGDDE